MLVLAFGFTATWSQGAETPYFVTYSDQMEEQGNLELGLRTASAKSARGNRFLGSALELEYGLLGWWTTEFYVEGQSTANESTLFTGYRLENRFRLTKEEHWVNPVLYLEFENINGADKTFLEVVGHDSKEDLAVPNDEARIEKKRELEGKVILGSNWRGWNFSENLIVEKNLAHQPWEFGYAAGVSRPLAFAARADRCALCLENFKAGLEVFGGLGDTRSLTLGDTSHYVGPTIQWVAPSGITIRISPDFGVTSTSIPVLWRFGISYEFAQFARRWRSR